MLNSIKRIGATFIIGLFSVGISHGILTTESLAESAPMKFKAPADSAYSEIISGYLFRDAYTQEFQNDEFQNPGMLWYERGEAIWVAKDGTQDKSCADCHGEYSSFKGIGATYPKWNEKLMKPITLEQQVNLCRVENMGAEEWKWESDHMLSTVVLIKNQSKGMPVNVQIDGPMEPHFLKGKQLYYERTGQLNLSCANCHEDNTGNYIRADYLSQGHSNGFPTYRLKDQGILSLHKRFEGCVRDTRAEFYKSGSPELVDLEIYAAWRGRGLPVETPSVRP